MILYKNKILSNNVALKIKDLVSFRNLLVHRYGKLDEKEEFTHISENHKDIEKFIEEIDKYLK
jgi:uncharacterized protein YutE (UPF0331/DUF86 family)